MNFLDLEALSGTRLESDPFNYVVVPGFIPANARAVLSAAFPKIDKPGSFPVESLSLDPVFVRFLAELEGTEFRRAMAMKLEVPLEGRPTMVTVRGQARRSDGQIHADSETKLVTVLIYMNDAWEAPGGRLRLLRSSYDLADMVAEVPPDAGTMLAFRVTPRSWHGHAPASGPRRVIQLNWVEDESVVKHENMRHGLSAKVKRLFDFAK